MCFDIRKTLTCWKGTAGSIKAIGASLDKCIYARYDMSPEATLDNVSVYQPAYDLQTTKYIMASALAVRFDSISSPYIDTHLVIKLWFYDYLLGLFDEIRLLTLRSFSMPLAVYFLSR